MMDQAHDPADRELYRLTKLFDPPEYVKQASRDRLNGDEGMGRHMYADMAHGLYPTHSAPATWISTLFFLEKQSEHKPRDAAEIMKRLQKSAEYFGIASDFHELVAAHAGNTKQAEAELSDEDFAITWEADGQKQRYYPLRNPVEIFKAAEYFNQYRSQFDYTDRQRVAVKILHKAAEQSVDLAEYAEPLQKSAGWGVCDHYSAMEILAQRITLLGPNPRHREASEGLKKLAADLKDSPEQLVGFDCRHKLATVLDLVDAAAGLKSKYASGQIDYPEDVLFALTEKVARAVTIQHVQTINGNIYNLDELERIPYAKIAEWLGDDVAESVSAGGLIVDRMKLAEVIPTLDRATARSLEQLATMQGVRPAATMKTAAEELPLSGANLIQRAARIRNATAVR